MKLLIALANAQVTARAILENALVMQTSKENTANWYGAPSFAMSQAPKENAVL